MNSDTTFTLPNLLCEEDDSSLLELKITSSKPKTRSEDDQYILSLIESETKSNCYGYGYVYVSDDENSTNWFKCARLDAINWIFNTREILGFHFRTAYLSVIYFDRFSSKRVFDNGKEWAIQLLSIACLSLAAKMEEHTVPSLSSFKSDGYNFESGVIQRMELLVLTTLDWKMCCISPFVYIHHFFSKICDEHECNEFLMSKAIGLILNFSKEVNLMDHRPSVVAIAAALLAGDDQLTRNTLESKIGVVPSLQSVEKERIYHCYNLLKEIETKKNNAPESLKSFGFLRNHCSPFSTIDIKRKHTYNVFEQKCPLQKISRRL